MFAEVTSQNEEKGRDNFHRWNKRKKQAEKNLRCDSRVLIFQSLDLN